MILAMEIEQASAKVRYRPPDDDGGEDAALDVCACEIPIITFLRVSAKSGTLGIDAYATKSDSRGSAHWARLIEFLYPSASRCERDDEHRRHRGEHGEANEADRSARHWPAVSPIASQSEATQYSALATCA